MKKYVPKKITESEIEEIRDSVKQGYKRIGYKSPGLIPHYKRICRLLKVSGNDSFAVEQVFSLLEAGSVDSSTKEQIRQEFILMVVRFEGNKALRPCWGFDIDKLIDKYLTGARYRRDHVFFRRFSNALKPQKIPITDTETFLLSYWARGSFALTDRGIFPALVRFTVSDLSLLMQAVFETNGLTESSLAAIIGRKLKLKTIKHCKIKPNQADRWIQRFKIYKTNHFTQIKDRLAMWQSFVKERERPAFTGK